MPRELAKYPRLWLCVIDKERHIRGNAIIDFRQDCSYRKIRHRRPGLEACVCIYMGIRNQWDFGPSEKKSLSWDHKLKIFFANAGTTRGDCLQQAFGQSD